MQNLLELSYDELIQSEGEIKLLSLARFSAGEALGSDPAAGLFIIDKVAPLLEPTQSADEASRDRLWMLQIDLLIAYVNKRDDESRYRPAKGLPETLTDQHVEAVGHLERAFRSIADDREPEGLLEIDRACELLPALNGKFANAIDNLRSDLLGNAGTVAFNERRITEATEYYTRMLPISLRLASSDRIVDLLTRLDDITEFQDLRATSLTLSALGAMANSVESLLGGRGTRLLQSMYRDIMIRWMRSQRLNEARKADAVFRLFRLAKGRRFGSTLVGATDYDWRRDPAALKRLENIQEARTKALEQGPDPELVPPDVSLDSQLMGPIGKRDRHTGMNSQERFENLRHTFDGYLANAFLASALEKIPRDWSGNIEVDPADLGVTDRDVQAQLDDQSVLLDLLVVDMKEGSQLLFAFAITRDETQFFTAALTETGSLGGVSELESETLLGRLVADLRCEVQARTESGQHVSKQAQELRQPDMLLGPLVGFLEEQSRKGRRHLCIVPHRDLHFLPFHLLGIGDRTLADDWVVTYLPNLHLLFDARPRGGAEPTRSVLSVGMDFLDTNPWQLVEIEAATTSAAAVAQLFGEKALLNEDATESAVLHALQSARYAYFYTHGTQCVYAPAFHRIFCAPDGEQDGAVNAYELLGLDLERLEVLGTAACETALGRVDLGDNLTGLPASFFQAGVQSMVGTLWEVHADTAEFFFLSFFRELSEGRPRLEAFECAQRETRSAYPLFMDWGAFHFMGAWA